MISFSAVWVRAADVPPTTSGLYRVFFGFLILFIATFIKKEMRTIGVKKLLLIILCGFIFALDLFFWHESIFFIGPGLATILSNFQAFILAAIGILFFGEKIRPRFLLSIPAAILGLFFVVGINWHGLSPNYKTGIYLGLLTAICYAGFLISLQKIQREESHSSFFFTLMLISLVCTIFLALKMVLYGDPFIIPDTTKPVHPPLSRLFQSGLRMDSDSKQHALDQGLSYRVYPVASAGTLLYMGCPVFFPAYGSDQLAGSNCYPYSHIYGSHRQLEKLKLIP